MSSPTQVPSPLQYRALNQSIREIRLLRICFDPDSETSLANLELVYTELQPDLDFTAISYAWGSQQIRKQVQIDGHSVLVGETLYELLQQLIQRPPWSQAGAYNFWIDAICINQQDDAEKSVQVRGMSELYATAHHVLVWLGPERDDSAFVLWKLRGGAEASRQSSSMVLRRDVIEGAAEDMSNLARLFMRPFFTRAWYEIGPLRRVSVRKR